MEDIKQLIEKINQEGVLAAQEKARGIEKAAREKAEEILEAAKKEAERMLAEAKVKLAHMETKERALLAQAARDVLLVLRKEINVMLEKIIISEVRKALDTDTLSRILTEMIIANANKEGKNIVVSLKKEDAHILEKEFLSKLKDQARKTIVLKPSEEITGGFTISYDSGKSEFDFTDKALADYIGAYLKPELNKILKEAQKE